jgi:hypothetical protein
VLNGVWLVHRVSTRLERTKQTLITRHETDLENNIYVLNLLTSGRRRAPQDCRPAHYCPHDPVRRLLVYMFCQFAGFMLGRCVCVRAQSGCHD